MIYIYIIILLSNRYHSLEKGALVLRTLKELRGHKALTDDGAYNILLCIGGHAELYIGNWSPIFKRSMSGFITCEAVMLRDHVTFDASFDYNLVST